MAYNKTVWKDRVVQFQRRFDKTLEGSDTVTLTPNPGAITEAGTLVSAAVMNKIEQGVFDAHALVATAQSAADSAAGVAASKATVASVTTAQAQADQAFTNAANNRVDILALQSKTNPSGFRDGIEVDTTGLGGYLGLKLYENPQSIISSNRFTEAKSNIYNTAYNVSMAGSIMRRIQRCAMVSIRPTVNKYLYSIVAFYEMHSHHWTYITTNNNGNVKVGNVTSQNDSVFNSSTDNPGAGCFTGNPAHPISWGISWDNATKVMNVHIANMGDTPAYTIDFTMEVIFI